MTLKKVLSTAVILVAYFFTKLNVSAENINNLSYFVSNDEIWKISEISKEIDNEKIMIK